MQEANRYEAIRKVVEHNPKFVALGIAMIAVLLYIPSFWVPFYLDDYSSIVGHERLIREEYALYLQANPRRLIPYLTIVFDYLIWGDNPAGYHIVNVAIHAVNVTLVFLVIRAFARQSDHAKHAVLFAGIVALVWAVHPLMSQPVVYIVQRITLIAVTFYLMTLYFWVSYRLTGQRRFVALSVGSGVLALLSKEIAFTLPLVVLLIDYLFFKKPFSWVIKVILACLVAGTCVFVAGIMYLGSDFWPFLDQATRDHEILSRSGYFWAQQEVVFQYLYKFIWPYPLLLEYPYYQGKTFIDVWPFFVVHVGLLVTSILTIRKFPLIAFGIIFFYVSLLIESSFIPIRDFGVEHRSYLGGIGIITALMGLFWGVFNKLSARISAVIGIAVVITLCTLTTHRIIQWQERISFYEQELEHNAQHPRVQHTLGKMLMQEGRYEEAERYFRSAFLDAFERDAMTLEVAKSFLDITIHLENYSVAQRFTQEIMDSFSRQPDWQAEILASYAQIPVKLGRCEEALQIYEHALSLSPNNLRVIRLMRQCEN